MPGARPPCCASASSSCTPRDTSRGDGDRDLDLTAKEFALLRYFMTHAGEVVSQEELLEHVWDEHADPFTNTVRVTVGTLRRKVTLEDEEQLIETVIGRGYRLREHDVGRGTSSDLDERPSSAEERAGRRSAGRPTRPSCCSPTSRVADDRDRPAATAGAVQRAVRGAAAVVDGFDPGAPRRLVLGDPVRARCVRRDRHLRRRLAQARRHAT